VIAWSQCPDVESVPDRCGGAWVVKDSRVIVESCILDNAEAGASPEEIADWFEVPGGVDAVRRILAFAATAADSETIYLHPICDRCKDCFDAGLWCEEEKQAACPFDECTKQPVAYIRADLFYAKFNAKVDEIIENSREYEEERDLYIATLVGLLKRARASTDDHALFSDIGEAIPSLRSVTSVTIEGGGCDGPTSD
jgi:uncharacterized protein (DUF433 family)